MPRPPSRSLHRSSGVAEIPAAPAASGSTSMLQALLHAPSHAPPQERRRSRRHRRTGVTSGNVIHAPKGHRIPAQGIALVMQHDLKSVLKERRIETLPAYVGHSKICGVPSERGEGDAFVPRVAPRADMRSPLWGWEYRPISLVPKLEREARSLGMHPSAKLTFRRQDCEASAASIPPAIPATPSLRPAPLSTPAGCR